MVLIGISKDKLISSRVKELNIPTSCTLVAKYIHSIAYLCAGVNITSFVEDGVNDIVGVLVDVLVWLGVGLGIDVLVGVFVDVFVGV